MSQNKEVFDAVKKGDKWVVDPNRTIQFDSTNDFSPVQDQLINSERSWLRRWRLRFSSRISGVYLADLVTIGIGAYFLTFAPSQDLYQQFQTATPSTEAVWDIAKLGVAYMTRKIPGMSIKALDIYHDLAVAGRFKREEYSDNSGVQ